MKRTVYQTSKTFRCTNTLVEGINDLANRAQRHPSDLIRQAVGQYVTYYREHPDELRAL
jgi:predicted transcriptional regulator